MASLEEYRLLVSSQHRDKPKFIATIDALINPFVQTINTALTLPEQFDVDTAIGVQLDAVGQWVGASRYIPLELRDIYFTWNDVVPPATSLLGWGKGIWITPTQVLEGLSYLQDPIYRIYIYARIANNTFLGDAPSAYQVLRKVYGTNILINDNQNMTMTLTISGTINPAIKLLAEGGFIDIRPMGVNLTINYP